MIVIVDSKVRVDVGNSVKAIIIDDNETERHVNVTDEGIIVDIVKEGRVVKTMSITHEEMLELP